jgi:hypothetical protein
MFKILSLKENIENLVSISRPYLSQGATENDLKKAYHEFLRKAQPSELKMVIRFHIFMNQKM